LLQRALPYVEPADQGPWRLLLARTRLVAGQPAAAAADLLQLAETAPDPALAATALYYVGVAHERLARADVARRIYRELLQRDDLPAPVRADATQALQRLGD
jgi:TolA-binding protein